MRLRKFNGLLYLDVFFEKDFEPHRTEKALGLDVGIKKLLADSDGNVYGTEIEFLLEKIQGKKQKSKAWHRALREKEEYINRTVKELPEAHLVIEDLKNIRRNSKQKSSKKFRTKAHYWTYRQILRRIELHAEVVGVQCLRVSPSYTSQTCSVCGDIRKENRYGEMFQCVNCGHAEDADINAAKNILSKGFARESMVPGK